MSQLRDLMHVLDFTSDDLATNRRGMLSPRQRKRLIERAAAARIRANGQMLAAIGLGGAAGACSVFASVSSFASALRDTDEPTARVLATFIGMLALLAGTIFLRGAVNTFASRRVRLVGTPPDDVPDMVEQVRGRLEYDVSLYLDRGTMDTFVVGGVTFEFDAERHSALLDAGDLIVYYIAETHEIVAAEPM